MVTRWTRLVQVCIDGLQRGGGVTTQGHTSRGRRRGVGIGWGELKVSGVFLGDLEGKAKVHGVYTISVDNITKVECKCRLAP